MHNLLWQKKGMIPFSYLSFQVIIMLLFKLKKKKLIVSMGIKMWLKSSDRNKFMVMNSQKIQLQM